MLTIKRTQKFDKDYERAIKRGYDWRLIKKVVAMLAQGEPLPPKYHDHALTRSKRYKGMRECHILPDWLLVYRIEQGTLTLILARTGTHSDLF